MSAQVAACSHAFGEVQPQFGVLGIGSVPALLVGQIGEHGPAQFAFFKTHAEFRQVGGKGVYVMVVIPRILAKIVARQLTGAPGPVKGMAEQIERRDAGIQLVEEFGGSHIGPRFGVPSIYGRPCRPATMPIVMAVTERRRALRVA